MKIDCDSDGCVTLSQTHCIQRIFGSHLPLDSFLAHVPCNALFADLTCDKHLDPITETYANMIGMLQRVENGTLLDIQFVVNSVAHFF